MVHTWVPWLAIATPIPFASQGKLGIACHFFLTRLSQQRAPNRQTVRRQTEQGARTQRETRSTHRACPDLRAQPATAAWCQTISQWTWAGGY